MVAADLPESFPIKVATCDCNPLIAAESVGESVASTSAQVPSPRKYLSLSATTGAGTRPATPFSTAVAPINISIPTASEIGVETHF